MITREEALRRLDAVANELVALRAVLARIGPQGGKLIIEDLLRLPQQAAHQRALAVVHAATGDEAQQVDALLPLEVGVECAHQK